MKQLFVIFLLWFYCGHAIAQTSETIKKDSLEKTGTQKDSLSKSHTKKDSTGFDRFNAKAEHLFKILPVPIYSYSPEAGNIYGLAKFNVINLSKKDTISKASKLSGVFTTSTLGRVNASIATQLVFDENKYVIISYVNYKKQPEYIWDIGNTITDDPEQDIVNRFVFAGTALRLVAKDFYIGVPFEVADYFGIIVDSNSFLLKDNVTGLQGGTSVGLGLAAAYDTRDNRYNPKHGSYILGTAIFYPGSWGPYSFSKFALDARKFLPWKKNVIAGQVTTSYANGNVPFYELPEMGGDSQMRGYYEGGLRDNVLVDAQVELRLHIWNIFGIVGWFGVGQVQNSYSHVAMDQFHLSYGPGLRIKVDSKHDTNLRFDFGFGPGGIQGFYVNFGEAF
ncbi:MAG TPA: BamA/TamA family outer membrane protein [Chitinophagaceae bacterium]|nr:BamA/TamA family outer membrane protein [Chitinophagaceae bacterium]